MSLTTKIREYRARDKYNPSLKLAMDIAKVFGCTVEELFFFED